MSYHSNVYRNYALVMLMLVYIFNFLDRQLLVILQESIKKELHLSDTQLGLLSGFSFAIFYVSMGIPIAMMADRGNRRNIIAISLGLWSIMTSLSGLARNFTQLLLARIGVGVGEAGGTPPAHAMISDYFEQRKRATALALYSSGIYIGMMLAYVMGGFFSETLGWRTAFFVVGIPGVLFSLLFYGTVREPKRGATDINNTMASGSPSTSHVLRLLYSNRTFVWLSVSTALHCFCIYAMVNWAPSFLARVHGLTIAQVGMSLGLAFGIGGGLGTFGGGVLADHFGKTSGRRYLTISAFAILISIPCLAGALFLHNSTYSVTCFGLCCFLYSMYLGPAIAVAHKMVPASMRSLTSAILSFILTLFGLGLGPLTIGVVSDLLASSTVAESLRWAMSVILGVSFMAAISFFAAARQLNAEDPDNSLQRQTSIPRGTEAR